MQRRLAEKWIVKQDEGMVLILVMLVLLAAIIIGTYSMSSSNIEVRITGNELKYKQDFYTAEGAAEFLIDNFKPIVNNLSGGNLSEGETRDITADVLGKLSGSSVISNARISITYERKFEKVTGSGVYTHHYKIVSKAGDQEIEVGVEL